MKICLDYEENGYYRDIDFGKGYKARIRSLNDHDYFEIRDKSGFKMKINKEIVDKMKNDESFSPSQSLNIHKFQVNQIIMSLTDPIDKPFEKGGAGWNFDDLNGKPMLITEWEINHLPRYILRKLKDEIIEFKKRNDELDELEKN